MTAVLLVVVLGGGLLVGLGVLIGTQLDTEAQRRARRGVAAERRLLAELRRAWRAARGCDPEQLCPHCPFR